jgi:putative membrane protein
VLAVARSISLQQELHMKLIPIASAIALAVALPATAQMASTTSMSPAATMSPQTGLSAQDYVKLAADSDMYEIQSSRLANSKSQRKDVKDFAKQIITDHMMTSKALMAGLRNKDRTIARPSMKLSSEKAAMIELLRKAPRDQFDNLYLQQQATAHQQAWAIHKGYATDGTDPTLKQIASTAVPVIERHLTHVQQLVPAGMAGATN